MTYQVFFNLDDAPFRLTPDPEYFFPSKRHSEALETLIYCVESGEGFVQITGEPGVGKTLLIRSFLDQLADNVNTALILHPRLEPEDLFKVILEDLGLAPENMQEMSKESLLRSFRDILLKSAKQGRRTIVIIDEAQEIPENTLEELRLLSNLETDKEKLLQIILVGQPELDDKLNQDRFKQLHQRITIRYRLDKLTLDETTNYIHHRLKVAGGGTIIRFGPKIIRQIHTISKGTPRIINTLCERSLMAAFVDGKSSVNQDHLHNAMQSLGHDISKTGNKGKKKQLAFLLFLVLLLAGTALYFSNASFQKLTDLKSGQLIAFLQAKKIAITTSLKEPPVEITAGERVAPVTVQLSEQAVQTAQTDDSDHENDMAAVTETTEDILAAAEISKEQDSTSPVVQSAEPEETENSIALPAGWRSITIDQKEKKALLFESNNQTSTRELTLPTGTTLEDGIYLLGQDKDTPFLFNHRSFFSWQTNQSLSEWLFQQFADDQSSPVIPVIVSSSAPEYLPGQMELSEIRTMVKNWAATFEQKDIQELMRYYDNSLIDYRLFRDSPTVKSHAEVTAKKLEIFEKNKALFLQISEPVCIVNSEDPSQAIALFHQRFISTSYNDSGIKVLYLRKTGAGNSKKPQWVITGRLWLPARDET